MTGEKPRRYRLDVSAQFYPIISTPRSQSLFRFAAELDAPVDAATLQRATADALTRFPTFRVRLKMGYAWYFFEENSAPVPVVESDGKLLTPLRPKDTAGYPFRMAYRGNTVEFEVFHAVADGMSAMEFFKAVLLRYAVLCGRSEGVDAVIREPSDEEEAEDAFRRYYRPIRLGDVDLKSLMGAPPFLLPGTVSKEGYSATHYAVRTADLLAAAKAKAASLTAFIGGVIAYTVCRYAAPKRPIAVMVPVNLRKMFPSRTMRNFVNFVRLVFRPKDCDSLDACVSSAAVQLREKATKEEMEKFFATTVRAEKSLVLSIAPLWFKIFMARLCRPVLKSRQTMIFSNIGKVDLPADCGVKRVVFNLNVSKNAKVNLGAVTLGDETTFAFTRSIYETDFEDEFVKVLRGLSVPLEASGTDIAPGETLAPLAAKV